MRKKSSIILASVVTILSICCLTAYASTVFLPDWQGADITKSSSGTDTSKDENFCATATKLDSTELLYHKATSCPEPKIYDNVCAHSSEWITECYCPSIFNKVCTSPYIGDNREKYRGHASCDGKFVACCDDSCPSGYSKNNPGGCGQKQTNGCGNMCYGPYQSCCSPSPSESGCSCGTYSCGDGCGGTRTCCSSCPEPEPAPVVPSSSSSSSSGSSSSGSSSGSSGSGSGSDCSLYNNPFDGAPMLSAEPKPATYWNCPYTSTSPKAGLTCWYPTDICRRKLTVCPGLGYENDYSQGYATVWLEYAGFACFEKNWTGKLKRYYKENWLCWSGAWPDANGNTANSSWCNGNKAQFQIVQSAQTVCVRNAKSGEREWTKVVCDNKQGYGRDTSVCYNTQAECEAAKSKLSSNPYWGGLGGDCDSSTGCEAW